MRWTLYGSCLEAGKSVARSLNAELEDEDEIMPEEESEIVSTELEAWAASEDLLSDAPSVFLNDVTRDEIEQQLTRFEEEYVSVEEDFGVLQRGGKLSGGQDSGKVMDSLARNTSQWFLGQVS